MLDDKLVKQLRKSKIMTREFYPMVIDFDDEILGGQHRKVAGWELELRIDTREYAKEWNVPVKVAKLIVKAQLNTQRKPSEEETKEIVLDAAGELEKAGLSVGDVRKILLSRFPYSDRYLRKLLSAKYKKMKHKPRTGTSSSSAHKTTVSADSTSTTKVDSPQDKITSYITLPESGKTIKIESELPQSLKDVHTHVAQLFEGKITSTEKLPCPYCGEPIEKIPLAALAHSFLTRLNEKYGGNLVKMFEEEVSKHLSADEVAEGRKQAEKLRKQIEETEKTIGELYKKYPDRKPAEQTS